MTIRKTKIIATIGPASGDKKTFSKILEAGVNLVRLNFSHNTHSTHKEYIDMVRAVSKKMNKPVAIIQDLSGPKIRTGRQDKEIITLVNGKKIVLTTKDCIGDESILYINYKKLPQEVKKGVNILLDDGKVRLEVISKSKESISCKIIVGGSIKEGRGVNVPDV